MFHLVSSRGRDAAQACLAVGSHGLILKNQEARCGNVGDIPDIVSAGHSEKELTVMCAAFALIQICILSTKTVALYRITTAVHNATLSSWDLVVYECVDNHCTLQNPIPSNLHRL